MLEAAESLKQDGNRLFGEQQFLEAAVSDLLCVPSPCMSTSKQTLRAVSDTHRLFVVDGVAAGQIQSGRRGRPTW